MELQLFKPERVKYREAGIESAHDLDIEALLFSKEIKTVTTMISPLLASALLLRNKNNRPLSKQHVLFLTKEIQNDRWMENGESIKLARDGGGILDGQHRLTAICKAGKPILSLITIGLDAEIFKTLDTGKKRTAADALNILDYGNYNMLAGFAKIFVYHVRQAPGSDKSISTQEVINFVEKEDKQYWRDLTNTAVNLYTHFRMIYSPSQITLFLFILSHTDPDDYAAFMDKMFKGIGLTVDDVTWKLRDKLHRDLINPRRYGWYVKKALFIKTYNSFKLGKTTSPTFDPATDVFPTFVTEENYDWRKYTDV